MKNENYLVIQGWMLNELKLKGNELLMYSLIYGYSQDGINGYYGSIGNLADTLNLSRQTVINILRNLEDNNLIVKKDNKYFVKSDSVKKFDTGVKKLDKSVKKFDSDVKKIDTINIYNNKFNNIYKYIYTQHSEIQQSLIDFVNFRKEIKKPLTFEGLKRLISKLNKLAPDDFKTQKEILDQSILNGWRGIFPLKQNNQNFNKSKKETIQADREYETYSEEEIMKMMMED